MSLAPGWVDELAKKQREQGGVSDEPPLWAMLRAKGQKPWKRDEAKYRESSRRGGLRGAAARRAKARAR